MSNPTNPVKIIVLMNQQKLVSQICEVMAQDLGQPDCKLIEPFILKENDTLHPWLSDCTSQNTFMISSDKILTLVDPKPTILEKYQDLLK